MDKNTKMSLEEIETWLRKQKSGVLRYPDGSHEEIMDPHAEAILTLLYDTGILVKTTEQKEAERNLLCAIDDVLKEIESLAKYNNYKYLDFSEVVEVLQKHESSFFNAKKIIRELDAVVYRTGKSCLNCVKVFEIIKNYKEIF